MSEKSYLKNQIKLVSLNSKDMFTDEEYSKYEEIISYVNEINKLDASTLIEDEIKKKDLIIKRKNVSKQLADLISQHKGTPRNVRLKSVIYCREEEEFPKGITWRNLKLSKKIAEFESDMSRAMGLKTNDYTFDKIIVKWGSKSRQSKQVLDLLEQLVVDGFTMDLLVDGNVVRKKYRYFSSSAGQLRTDKCSFLSEDIWEKIKNRIECGMDWATINARGGINVNKLLAYWALCSSASIPWPEFDIDKVIVIPDFEAEVTDRVLYIKPNYTVEDGIRTVMINHVDGAGMYLPNAKIIPKDLFGKNFMIRADYIKGLVSPFDYLKFCEVHGIDPVIEDYYHVRHDLVKEDIQIILTASQFKLCKIFKSWEEYKENFKKYKCEFVIAQFEEDDPPDKTMNYQFIQALEYFTDK